MRNETNFEFFSPRKRVATAKLNTIRYQEYYWLKKKTQAKNRAPHSTTVGEAEQWIMNNGIKWKRNNEYLGLENQEL